MKLKYLVLFSLTPFLFSHMYCSASTKSTLQWYTLKLGHALDELVTPFAEMRIYAKNRINGNIDRPIDTNQLTPFEKERLKSLRFLY